MSTNSKKLGIPVYYIPNSSQKKYLTEPISSPKMTFIKELEADINPMFHFSASSSKLSPASSSKLSPASSSKPSTALVTRKRRVSVEELSGDVKKMRINTNHPTVYIEPDQYVHDPLSGNSDSPGSARPLSELSDSSDRADPDDPVFQPDMTTIPLDVNEEFITTFFDSILQSDFTNLSIKIAEYRTIKNLLTNLSHYEQQKYFCIAAYSLKLLRDRQIKLKSQNITSTTFEDYIVTCLKRNNQENSGITGSLQDIEILNNMASFLGIQSNFRIINRPTRPTRPINNLFGNNDFVYKLGKVHKFNRIDDICALNYERVKLAWKFLFSYDLTKSKQNEIQEQIDQLDSTINIREIKTLKSKYANKINQKESLENEIFQKKWHSFTIIHCMNLQFLYESNG